jgi:hypothetical protein
VEVNGEADGDRDDREAEIGAAGRIRGRCRGRIAGRIGHVIVVAVREVCAERIPGGSRNGFAKRIRRAQRRPRSLTPRCQSSSGTSPVAPQFTVHAPHNENLSPAALGGATVRCCSPVAPCLNGAVSRLRRVRRCTTNTGVGATRCAMRLRLLAGSEGTLGADPTRPPAHLRLRFRETRA